MVKEIQKSNTFQCEDCKLEFKEEKWAKKCEEWCIKYKSCNLEITKHCTLKE